MSKRSKKVIPFVLEDLEDDNKLPGTITITPTGIGVRFAGYGNSDEEGGHIVWIEMAENRLRVDVHDAIFSDEPETFYMDNAKETSR